MKSLITVLCSTVLLLIACQKSSGPSLKNAANISIYLTDDPSIQIQNLFVDIQRVEVKIEDDGVDSLGGWFNLNVIGRLVIFILPVSINSSSRIFREFVPVKFTKP